MVCGSAIAAAAQPTVNISTVVRGVPPVATSGPQFTGGNQLAIDSAGNLYVLAGGFRGRPLDRVTPAGVVTRVALVYGFYPNAIAVDSTGTAYVGDLLGNIIRRITPTGDQTAFYPAPGSGAPSLGLVGAMAIDGSGVLHVAVSDGIYKIVSGSAVRVAGGGAYCGTSPAIDGPIGVATFDPIDAMAFDTAGNIFVTGFGQTVRKVTPDGNTTTIAGARRTAGSTDGVGTAARFNNPTGIAIDAGGNLFIADSGNHTIRRMGTDGVVTTVAGTAGVAGTLDGAAASASFSGPYDLAFDHTGSLVVLDGSLRKLAAGTVTTFVVAQPSAVPLFSDAAVSLVVPTSVAIGPAAVRYVSDASAHAIRAYVGLSSREVLIGGKPGTAGSADGLATPSAQFGKVRDAVFDSGGNAYLLDGPSVRRVAADGTTTTFVTGLSDPGTITREPGGNFYVSDQCRIDRITAAGVRTSLVNLPSCATVRDLAADASGTLFAVANRSVLKITAAGVVTTLAGGSASGSVDGTGTAASFTSPGGLAIDVDGTMYVTDSDVIRRVTPDGVVTTVAGVSGTIGISDGDGTAARFAQLTAIAFGAGGVMYVSDGGRIRAVTTAAHVTTIAGDLAVGQTDGTGTAAAFNSPIAMASDPSGLLFVIQQDGRVRTVTTAGVVSTLIVGTSTSSSPIGVRTDGALTTPARFNAPTGIAYAPDGTLVIADTGNHTIRKIVAKVASTFAGTAGASGLVDASGAAARFKAPQGVAVDAAGSIYVADTGNNAVRKITSDGLVSTLPGTFAAPRGVAVDAVGTVYVADTGNHVIRAIAASGTVTIVAGSIGVAGSADGTGAGARFSSPSGIAVAPDGTIYIADTGNNTLRAMSSSGVVTTAAGAAGAAALTDGTGAAARFEAPQGITFDPGGGLYVADTGNAALRLGVIGGGVAPVITLNPTSLAVPLHGTAQFTCNATGTPSPVFRWERRLGNSGTLSLAEGDTYSGVDTPVLTITNAGASLDGAQYSCMASSAGQLVRSAAATLTVRVLTLSSASLVFNVMVDSAGAAIRTSPAQSVTVGWDGIGTPPWTVSADQPWVQIANGSGAGAGAFTVGITNPYGAGGPAQASATITLSSTADAELTKTIAVRSLRFTTDAAPIGVIDTPANNAPGLQGSLAVTGWALDDIEMDRVEIWRDAVPGETTPVFNGAGPGNGKIFIATATFVPGARPDVEAIYGSSRPGAHNAGWGYMMETHGLWNQGNGQFTLYAFGFDKSGASSTLATKTITIDNAHATKPFGTIDTPSYGGTVSGTIQNFGWALTPGATCSIANPNVQVAIDSGPLVPVVYGDARSDIAGGFPGYTNAAAAGGHYPLDTTTLTNGMHTIVWFVTDSCGHADGMGSRFFTVANASSIASTAPVSIAARAAREWTLVRGTTLVEPPAAMADATRVVRVGQAERIELQLPGDVPYTVGGTPLPIGASFDAAEGKFYWQPAAGFLGAYDLQFTAGSRVEKVRVVVGPPIRMVIDTPQAGNVLASSGFTLAGWAVDLASLGGAGIDTLHVWAYPLGGGAPHFVGIATAEGVRPEVARLYGAAFSHSGFGVTGTLPPGTYDFVVFAHSAASNTFAGTGTVRATVR
jgi:sugar lactone lactonase YvrE